MAISRSRRQVLASEQTPSGSRRRWILAGAAVVVAGTALVIWHATEREPTQVPRSVEVHERFRGVVQILDHGTGGGCVQPLTHGGSGVCGDFVLLPGQPAPTVGEQVNVAELWVPSKPDSAYDVLLIYPDVEPPGD